MKKILVLAFCCIGFTALAQRDLTGTWEGEFVKGTIGLLQPSKMVLEIVQVEGRLYCIFDLYPVDTRKDDEPNITYTMEGNCKPETVRFALIQGRVVEGREGPDFVQFIFEHKEGARADVLSGKWYRELEPVNSNERGSGTFKVRRVSKDVSDRLLLPKQEKKILQKLEKQDGR